ncbi:MAG TPA: glycoside hydrolase family 38 C-terminal domain-containing protein [Dehalococcoidia bacterium]
MTTEPAVRLKATVVSHAHWDREWYLPFQEFRMRLVRMMDQLLEILDTNPDYRSFMLDGHTLLVDDYLEVRPERRDDILRHVRTGRLLMGPWYVLADEFLPSGEAHIRNLLTGLRAARRFGEPMMVGYLPDAFGQIAAMPQILRGFGIDAAVMWRGVGREAVQCEFFWRSPDGSEVLTVHLPYGYGVMAGCPSTPERLRERIRDVLARLEPYVATGHLLLMNGADHLMPLADLPRRLAMAGRLVPGLEVEHGTLPEFVRRVREAIGERADQWPRLEGEFRSGERAHLLPGVLSARMWIKQRNRATEIRLSRWAEPFTAWASAATGAGARLAWAPLLRQSWRYLLQNQPHDSICGCSVDQVHEEMKTRYDWADQIAERAAREALEVLASRVGAGPAGRLVVFNPARGPRTDYVEAAVRVPAGTPAVRLLDPEGGEVPVQVLRRRDAFLLNEGVPVAPDPEHEVLEIGLVARDVPSLGYRALTVEPASRPAAEGPRGAAGPGTIENEHFAVQADPTDGTVVVRDKATGRVYRGLNRLVDGGDRGDEYTYCAPEEDRLVAAPAGPPSVRVAEAGPARLTLEIGAVYRLPRGLEPDRRRRSAATVDCPVTTRVSLYPGVRRVDFQTTVENWAEDHRLRVHFPTGLFAEESHAEAHFGVLRRAVSLPDGCDGWPEPPVGTQPQKAFVDVCDGERGVAVANRGLPEYEALAEGDGITLALTLLRCVGWLSRDDLASRKGHAGPMIETPGAQCLGRHTFEYAFIPHAGDWRAVLHEAHRFEAPMRAVVAAGEGDGWPAARSLVHAEPEALVVSAVKPAEDDDGVVVRLYNATLEPVRGRLEVGFPYARALRTNLDEGEERGLAPEELSDLAFGPNELVTLKFLP